MQQRHQRKVTTENQLAELYDIEIQSVSETGAFLKFTQTSVNTKKIPLPYGLHRGTELKKKRACQNLFRNSCRYISVVNKCVWSVHVYTHMGVGYG